VVVSKFLGKKSFDTFSAEDGGVKTPSTSSMLPFKNKQKSSMLLVHQDFRRVTCVFLHKRSVRVHWWKKEPSIQPH
jgi:hypothetical protein